METLGYTFAILTALFFGLQGFFGKNISDQLSPLLATWATFSFSAPFLLLYLAIDGIPPVSWSPFGWATISSFIINVFVWFLFFKALKQTPLAHTMPFTAFTPLFLIPVAFILIDELPNIPGIVGIFLVFVGGYTIHLRSGDFLSPFKRLKDVTGTRLMLVVAFLWSITATIEKVAVINSSQAFYGSIIALMLSLAYLPFILKNRRENMRLIKKQWPQLLLLGLIYGLMLVFQFTALKYLLVSYVIAFKRAGVIISVILGIIVNKEKSALKNLLSTIIMIIGVFLILL